MALGKCDQCKQYKELVLTTATGRRLCQDDADAFNGAALSMMTDGAGTGSPVAGAVNVTGWIKRVRKALGRSSQAD